MKSRYVFFGMIGMVVLLTISVFFSLSKANHTLASRSEKLVSLKLDSQILDEQQVALVRATKDVDKYTYLEKIAKSIVPQDKDQARAVREIVKIADASNVKLSVISFPTSTLGQPKIIAPAASTAAIKSVSPSITQVKAVENIPGVYVMEVNIQQDSTKPVTYSRMINFLSHLERNRRTAQVTSVTVQPDPENRNLLTFNLVVNIYIKP